MSEHRHIYGEIHNKTGMKRVFGEIRRDVDGAKSRPALTELYKRAGVQGRCPRDVRHV